MTFISYPAILAHAQREIVRMIRTEFTRSWSSPISPTVANMVRRGLSAPFHVVEFSMSSRRHGPPMWACTHVASEHCSSLLWTTRFLIY
jgi:hypothetical protein